MLEAGFAVISLDHEMNRPVVPLLLLDLASEGGQKILWELLSLPHLFAVHLGAPCGTASRARELPISSSLRAQGVPQPPPLRSAQHPLGLPNLSDYNQAKVDAANVLYELVVDILVFCHRAQIVISIENPLRSWLWTAMVAIVRGRDDSLAATAYNALHLVSFHSCCHGSTRRKQTGWLSTKDVFNPLQATCVYDHPHEPFNVSLRNSQWMFATSLEAAYPRLLAQRAAACLVHVAQQQQLVLSPRPRLCDLATAAQGSQTRKHLPLISDFLRFATQLATEPIPAGAKLMAPHLGGSISEEPWTTQPATMKTICWLTRSKLVSITHQANFWRRPRNLPTRWIPSTTWRSLPGLLWTTFFG